MGCPDAVRAAVLALPGIQSIVYEAQKDLFILSYRQDKIKLPTIFAAIGQAGRRSGREFLPQIVAG